MSNSSANSISSRAGKVNILKLHCMKLCSELDVKSFGNSWKVEVCNSVKLFKTMSFPDYVQMG